MSDLETQFIPGSLWSTVWQRTQQALARHAIQSISTRQIILADNGVDFVVRVVSSLAHKEIYRNNAVSTPRADDPFLPYEPDLFVCNVSPHYVCLLNKFNVIENHVLVVTRQYENQENLLTERDFAAWFSCLREFNSLGFYNGGDVAGASQSHKHMQLIPLPLSKQMVDFPFFSLLQNAESQSARNEAKSDLVAVSRLPVRHGIIELDNRQMQESPKAPEYLYKCYQQLLKNVGVEGVRVNGELRQTAPYNLLLSKNWMWMVPRSREDYRGISVNALGFAGSLFVRDKTQMEMVRKAGPMEILKAVALK